MNNHYSRRDSLKLAASMGAAAFAVPNISFAQAAAPAARQVQLTAADGHKFTVYRADPVGTPKGGIVILHAVYGLTTNMGDVCANWAKAGYTAIAPALFDRLKPNTIHPYTCEGVQAGTDGYNALTEAQIFADIAACVASAGGPSRTAISGFCTGGSWAWRAASKMDFAAHVNFYGSHVATPDYINLEPRSKTIIHYGDKDGVVPMPDVERIRARHPSVQIFIYPGAGHAFLNPDQQSYHAPSAEPAWARSIAFMDQQVGSKKG